jgi:hypothetical protein
MPLRVVIPFILFGACCFLQSSHLNGIREALRQRHPRTYRDLLEGAINPYWPLWQFCFSRRPGLLGDSLMERQVRRLRIVTIVAAVVWAGMAVSFAVAPIA